MGGGLMQLVAYGAQDVYLTSNPQITFFKVVYRRHTNFSIEGIDQTFNGKPEPGSRNIVNINRNGDLITKMWLKTTIGTSDTLTIVNGITYILENPIPINEHDGRCPHLPDLSDNYISADLSDNIILSKKQIKCEGFNDFLQLTIENAVTSTDIEVNDILTLSGFSNSVYNGSWMVEELSDYESGETDGIYKLTAPQMTITPIEESQFAQVQIYRNYEQFNWVDDLGYALINSVELQIGGTKIDKHYGRWMHIWSQLTKTNEHALSHTQMVNGNNGFNSNTLYVPLQFFCCRNDGLALPLIALQYHDVRLEFEFNSAANCISNLNKAGTAVGTKSENVFMSNTSVFINYIYLDSEERKRFSQASHEYLIEQLQFTGIDSVSSDSNDISNKIRLNYNHPIKELIWAVVKDDIITADKFTNFTNGFNLNPVSNAILQLNGHDRFSKQTGKYFNYVQPLTHHSNTPSAGINIYSFALHPEDHQPSGTCNFSRIDNATLNITTKNSGSNLYIYAINYNILRIMSGMGGIAYSN